VPRITSQCPIVTPGLTSFLTGPAFGADTVKASLAEFIQWGPCNVSSAPVQNQVPAAKQLRCEVPCAAIKFLAAGRGECLLATGGGCAVCPAPRPDLNQRGGKAGISEPFSGEAGGGTMQPVVCFPKNLNIGGPVLSVKMGGGNLGQGRDAASLT